MRKILKALSRVLVFILLTVVTQIGGTVYILTIIINNRLVKGNRMTSFILFLTIYLTSTFIIVPLLAPYFGRTRVNHSDLIRPSNYITVLFNRNYVVPEINEILSMVQGDIESSGITINYLDANFPFIDNFPLLPHISHDDGEKIDLSLVYESPEGVIVDRVKSVSGYGVFEGPEKSEWNQIDFCIEKGNSIYDYPKYLTFGKINKEIGFSEKGTKKLIEGLLGNKRIRKIFIEPHLKKRLKLIDSRIRYQGCQSVRHDDHIHIEL